MRTAPLLAALALSLISTGCSTPRKIPEADKVIIVPTHPETDAATAGLQKKYAQKLGIAPEKIRNIKLYKFIDEWLNTPYLWGGTDKRGIDCSAFIQRLLSEVYNVQIPRTSEAQFFAKLTDRFTMSSYAYEGDLVFFRTMKGKYISHVGLYLDNNKFVNSCSKGVTIEDLNSPYWKKKYVAAGRIKM